MLNVCTYPSCAKLARGKYGFLMVWTKACGSSSSTKGLSCWRLQLYAAAHQPELPVIIIIIIINIKLKIIN